MGSASGASIRCRAVRRPLRRPWPKPYGNWALRNPGLVEKICTLQGAEREGEIWRCGNSLPLAMAAQCREKGRFPGSWTTRCYPSQTSSTIITMRPIMKPSVARS